MKKLLVLLGAVIIAVLAISPKLLGLAIQDDGTETRLAELTGQPGLSLVMESGWFSSEGEMTIQDPIIAGNLYRGVVIVADLDIMHGPLVVTDDGVDMGIASARIVPVVTGLDADDPIQQLLAADMQTTFTVLAGLDGSLRMRMDAGELQFVDADAVIRLDDLRADLHIARSGNARLSASSTEFTLSDTLNDVTVRDSLLALYTEELSATPLPGGLSFQAVQIQINRPQRLTLNGIGIDYVARPEPDTSTISLQQNVQIDEIVSQLPIDSLTMTSEITGIDENIVSDYIAFVQGAQGNLQSMTDMELQSYIAEHSEQLVLDLVRGSLQQTGQLTLQAYGGEHRANVAIDWPGMPGLPALDALDVRQVLRVIDVTLNITANEEALYGTPVGASIRSYVAQGMLPQENGNVMLNASLQNSVLIVNEQRIALEPFLGF